MKNRKLLSVSNISVCIKLLAEHFRAYRLCDSRIYCMWLLHDFCILKWMIWLSYVWTSHVPPNVRYIRMSSVLHPYKVSLFQAWYLLKMYWIFFQKECITICMTEYSLKSCKLAWAWWQNSQSPRSGKMSWKFAIFLFLYFCFKFICLFFKGQVSGL